MAFIHFSLTESARDRDVAWQFGEARIDYSFVSNIQSGAGSVRIWLSSALLDFDPATGTSCFRYCELEFVGVRDIVMEIGVLPDRGGLALLSHLAVPWLPGDAGDQHAYFEFRLSLDSGDISVVAHDFLLIETGMGPPRTDPESDVASFNKGWIAHFDEWAADKDTARGCDA